MKGKVYWDWMNINMPLSMNEDGTLREFSTANPDSLREDSVQESGITQDQYQWMQEAYEALTPKQQRIWDFVMREQTHSITDVADEMGISQPSASRMLDRAKQTIVNYLRSKQENAAREQSVPRL